MEIGIVTVRDRNYHPNRRLLQTAAAKGHPARLIHPYRVWPMVTALGPGFGGETDVASLDAVMPRQGATIGDSSLALLHHFSCLGVPLVNRFHPVCIARSQIMTLQVLAAAGLPVPKSLFVNSEEGFAKAIPHVGGFPVVVKQVSGRQGAGIYRVKTREQADALMADHMDPRAGILVQRFFPPPGRQDIRVMVIDEKAVAAMQMSPAAGDFRANFHLTRESQPFKLTPAVEALAVRAAGTVGLDIAGVDMIVDRHQNLYVIEVNYSPGFKGLEKATGLDIAGCMIDCAVSRGRNHGRSTEKRE